MIAICVINFALVQNTVNVDAKIFGWFANLGEQIGFNSWKSDYVVHRIN